MDNLVNTLSRSAIGYILHVLKSTPSFVCLLINLSLTARLSIVLALYSALPMFFNIAHVQH